MKFKLTKEVKNQLHDLGVVALYMFGSRAQGIAGPLSDYDFAVLMKEGGHKRGGKAYDQLYDILAPLCPRSLDNDIIDIVFLINASLELKLHVVRYGQVLFETNTLARLRFETQTMLEYSDFRPLLDMQDQAILAAL
jgi:predicted nucleotidyltransferase